MILQSPWTVLAPRFIPDDEAKTPVTGSEATEHPLCRPSSKKGTRTLKKSPYLSALFYQIRCQEHNIFGQTAQRPVKHDPNFPPLSSFILEEDLPHLVFHVIMFGGIVVEFFQYSGFVHLGDCEAIYGMSLTPLTNGRDDFR